MKNKIKFPFMIIFLFSFILLNAQKSVELKLYNSMQYHEYSPSSPSNYSIRTTTTQLLKLMPGFSIQKQKSSFDILISQFSNQNTLVESYYSDSMKKYDSKYRMTTLSLGCLFIKNWLLKSSGNQRFNYFLGAGLEPSFVQGRGLPYNVNSFKTRLTNYSMNAFIIPKLRYKLNEKLALELTIPLNLLNISYQRQWVGNPMFSPQQQITQTLNLNELPKQVIVNFGLACKL